VLWLRIALHSPERQVGGISTRFWLKTKWLEVRCESTLVTSQGCEIASDSAPDNLWRTTIWEYTHRPQFEQRSWEMNKGRLKYIEQFWHKLGVGIAQKLER
jgi:hypothetical protein